MVVWPHWWSPLIWLWLRTNSGRKKSTVMTIWPHWWSDRKARVYCIAFENLTLGLNASDTIATIVEINSPDQSDTQNLGRHIPGLFSMLQCIPVTCDLLIGFQGPLDNTISPDRRTDNWLTAAVQSLKAVSAHFTSEQILPLQSRPLQKRDV